MRRRLVGRLAAGLLLLAAAACAGQRPMTSPASAADDPGEMRLRTLDGRELLLSSFRGSLVLLDFFATWSDGSIAMLMAHDRLLRELAGVNLQVVAVSLDLQPEALVAAFSEEMGLSFPLYLADRRIAEGGETPYGYIKAIPVCLLLDERGRMINGYLGTVPNATIREHIVRYLTAGREAR